MGIMMPGSIFMQLPCEALIHGLWDVDARRQEAALLEALLTPLPVHASGSSGPL